MKKIIQKNKKRAILVRKKEKELQERWARGGIKPGTVASEIQKARQEIGL